MNIHDLHLNYKMNKTIIFGLCIILIVLVGCDMATINIEQSDESNKVYNECKKLCNPVIISNDLNNDRVTIYKNRIKCSCQ